MKILISFILGILLYPASVSTAENSDLEIAVKGVRNQVGHVSIAVFNKEDGFPENIEKAYALQISEIEKGQARFYFEDLPAGEYAFAILHDEDRDGRMKKNLLGIPREGFAFSLNFRPGFKSPSFRQTSFRIENVNKYMEVEMIYYQ